MNNPLISIIIPVFNVEKYLGRCIESVLSQTYTNLEVILVDDGSLDSSGAICDKYEKNDNRIRVLHKENGGAATSRNAGLDICHGEYVSFIDSDDYIDPNFIYILYSLIVKNHSKISVCSMSRVDRGKIDEYFVCKDGVVDYLSYLNSFPSSSCCNKLYSIRLFDKIRFPNHMTCEDAYVSFEIAYAAKTISLSSRFLYFYCRNRKSVSQSLGYSYYFDMFFSREHIINFILEKELGVSLINAWFEDLYICYINCLRRLPRKHQGNQYEIINSKFKILVEKLFENLCLLNRIKAKFPFTFYYLKKFCKYSAYPFVLLRRKISQNKVKHQFLSRMS